MLFQLEKSRIRMNIMGLFPSQLLKTMKTKFLAIAGAVAMPLSTNSCMTTYDANGNPVQSVSPAGTAAIAGAAALGAYHLGRKSNERYRGHDVYYYNGRRCYYNRHGRRIFY